MRVPILIAALALTGCERGGPGAGRAPPAPSGPRPVAVFAAASTGGPLDRIAERFEQETGIPVELNYAASSTLARQIEAGADAGVFISANAEWMDYLERLGLIEAVSRADVLSNGLVVVVPRGGGPAGRGAADLPALLAGRVALGDPGHVPAGRYARQALERLGLWDQVSGRVIGAIDVRAALRLAETGEADAAIVYATNAIGSAGIQVAARLDPSLHDPIVYSAASCAGAGAGARAFLEYLRGAEAAAIFGAAGFAPLRPGSPP
jgi:molybdate transport system substrate-binding protein